MYIEVSRLINITLLIWGAFFSYLVAIDLIISNHNHSKDKLWMIALEFVIGTLLVNDAMSWYFLGMDGTKYTYLLYISNFLVFFLTDAALFVFQQYIKTRISLNKNEKEIKITISSLIAIVAMAMVIISCFNQYYFYVDANNIYHRGDGYIVSVVLAFSCMILDMITLIQYKKRFKTSAWLATFSFILLPLLTAIIQVNLYGLSLINFSIAISVMLMFFTSSREQDNLLAHTIQSNKQTKEKLEIASTLNNCVKELSNTTNDALAINNLLKIVSDYFHSDRSYIFLIDYDNQVVNNIYEYCHPNVQPQINNLQNVPLDTISEWMVYFERQEPYYMKNIQDVKQTKAYDVLDDQDITSLLAVPLVENNKIIGLLGVDNPREHSEDSTLLTAIQFFITKALQRKNEKEYLEYLSYRDSLTGLFNRNRYIELLNESKGIHLKNTGVAWIDINGLKEVNDNNGHSAGDDLITSVTNVINLIFQDKAYRTGGDEFAIISIGINENTFKQLIDDLNQAFMNKDISCSIGYLYQDEVSNLENIMKQADAKMYQQKQKYYESHEA